jgi:hypothetical protein
MIISIGTEKAFNKFQHPLMIKVLMKLGIEGMHFNIIKGYTWQAYSQHHTKWEKLKPFLLKSGMRQRGLLSLC